MKNNVITENNYPRKERHRCGERQSRLSAFDNQSKKIRERNV